MSVSIKGMYLMLSIPWYLIGTILQEMAKLQAQVESTLSIIYLPRGYCPYLRPLGYTTA